MDPIPRIVRVMENNISRAYQQYCADKEGADLQRGLTRFMEIDLEAFITSMCKKYGVSEKDFYEALTEYL